MTQLPDIPAKRYFTIGEVGDLCAVKPHVLRYWEQEFTQLKPIKRRGNRRYYQHHEVLMVRRIRELLYEHGYTISGARNKLAESPEQWPLEVDSGLRNIALDEMEMPIHTTVVDEKEAAAEVNWGSINRLRRELREIRLLLAA